MPTTICKLTHIATVAGVCGVRCCLVVGCCLDCVENHMYLLVYRTYALTLVPITTPKSARHNFCRFHHFAEQSQLHSWMACLERE